MAAVKKRGVIGYAEKGLSMENGSEGGALEKCVEGKRDDTTEEERIECFCGNNTEFGEMACCELCSGWFHVQCM